MPRGRSGRRTDYTWNGTVFGSANAADTASIQVIATIAGPGTLMRSRGELVASIDAPTDGDKVIISYGLIIADDDQVTAGVTAFPNPQTDMDANWLWHGFIPLLAQAANLEHAAVGRLTIDSKAMRRMKQNDQVVLVIKPGSQAGTPVTDTAGGVRLLVGS